MLQVAVTLKAYPVSLLSLFETHEVRRCGKLKNVSKTLQVLLPKGSNTRRPATLQHKISHLFL